MSTRWMAIGIFAVIAALWSAVGTAGDNAWSSIGPQGGKASDLELVDVGGEPLVFAATAGGGIYRTVPGSGAWQRVSDGLVSSFVVKVAGRETAAMPQMFAVTLAPGLQRSVDLGGGWEFLANELAGVMLRDIAVADGMSDVMFAATASDGVWISTDGGDHFSESNGGLTVLYLNKIALAPQFAISATAFAGTAGGVFRSVNQGATWNPVNQGLASLVITALAVSPNFLSDQTVFAGTPLGLHRSIDGGQSWTPVTDLIGSPAIRTVAVAPAYPSDPRIIIGTAGMGAFLSVDAGVTWTPLSAGLLDPTVVDVLIAPAGSPVLAWAATDGHGAHALLPSGSWTPVNEAMFACNVQAVAISPNFANDGLLLAGTNRGTFAQMFSQPWVPVPIPGAVPDVRMIAFAPAYPADPEIFIATLSHGCFRSMSGLDGFLPANSGLPSTDLLTVQPSPDFSNDNRVWAGTSASGLYQSLTRGQDWQPVPGFPGDAGVLSIGFSPEFASDETAFAGDWTGNIHRTSDGGLSFGIVFSQPDHFGMPAMAVSPAFSSNPTVYAGSWGDGLFISRDGGDTWTAVGPSIPSPWITDIWLHPEYPSRGQAVVATLTAGCFRTLDEGFTWEPFALGLTNPRTQQVRAVNVGGLSSFIVGTGGGSALRWDETSPAMTSAAPAEGAVIFNVNEDLTLTFRHEMDPDSLLLQIVPDPGPWTASWSGDRTQVTISHPPFSGDPTLHTVTVVEARDRYGAPVTGNGAPLEWSFTVDQPPDILAAGMWTSFLSPAGGTATLLAVSLDSDLDRIEIAPGVQLWDDGTNGDWSAGDGLFTLALDAVPAGLSPGAYMLPLTAVDRAGQTSATWPYLRIGEGAGQTVNASAAVELPLPYLFLAPSDPRQAPAVLVAGYWDTLISAEDGGVLTVIALVQDPDGPQDIERVDLLYQGMPTGLALQDDGYGGDWTAGDGLYTVQLDLPGGLPAADLMLEIVAGDRAGNVSAPWPYLTVTPLPLSVGIDASPLSGVVPLEVSFQAQADGGTPPYEFHWDFGDGGQAAGAAAVHAYPAAGTFQARLDVTDAAGELSLAAVTVRAVAPAGLEAAFTVSPEMGPGPFEFLATAAGGVPPYAFAWSFGDGAAGDGQRATHNFQTAGEKLVTLTVTDAGGNEARASDSVTVSFPPPLQVTVDADPQVGEPPLNVLLRAEVANGEPPFNYRWDLDTGLPGSADGNTPELRHAFPPGQFNVSVTVLDRLGASGAATITIESADLPQCDHFVGTEANIEPGPPLTAVYRVTLREVQVGDEANIGYFEDGSDSPCFFGIQRFSFPFEGLDLILSVHAHPDGCPMAPGSRGRFQLTYNGLVCPESVREITIP